jgi:hypothetical protein
VPILKMELTEPARRDLIVNYVLLEGNPGWIGLEPFSGNIFVAEMPGRYNQSLGDDIFLILVLHLPGTPFLPRIFH